MKYRIFNKISKKYENDLFLSQDGKRLIKENCIIPLTDDFIVEQGIMYDGDLLYENDIVKYDDGFIGVIGVNEIGTFTLDDVDLEEFDNIELLGNTNIDYIENFYGPDPDLYY